MRRWLYIAQCVAVVIVLWGALSSIPAFGQGPTTLDVTAGRAPTQLVLAADGGLLDLITYGSTATFNLKVTNVGVSRAYAVKLTGTAPTGPTVNPDGGLITPIMAVTPGSPTCKVELPDGGPGNNATFTCNFGDLPDGQLADGGFVAAASVNGTFTISLALPSRPFSTNCTLADGGSVAGNSLGDITLTASADNAPTVVKTFANTTHTRALADLAVKITGPDTANEGATVTYQVHGDNLGPCAANRPRLTTPGTGILTFQSNSAGECQQSGYPCTVAPSWPAGASIDVTSTYTLNNVPPATERTRVINQVDLNSSNTPNPDGGPIPVLFATPDPVTSNNTATTSALVTHSTGCNSVTGSTLGLFGIALLILTLRQRRRNT